MTLKIINNEERIKTVTGVKIVIFGPYGIGKTSLLKTLDESTTLCLDFEAGLLAVQDWKGDSINMRTWNEARDIACLIGGPNPALKSDQAYSQRHYEHVSGKYKDLSSEFFKYHCIFIDSITVASRLCFLWARMQPEAFSDRSGREDKRAAYGTLAQEMMAWLNQFQHIRGKDIIIVGTLGQYLDDCNRSTWLPQCEGAKTASEIPGIVDEVISMVGIKKDDGTEKRSFVCQTINSWGYPAKDRSGCLNMVEEPHLGKLLAKIKAKTLAPIASIKNWRIIMEQSFFNIGQKIPFFSVKEYLDDQSPIPEDIIYPRVLTKRGLLVFGGPPKIGKSDFLISWLIYMAAGVSFLGMTPSRPMKIFYMQTEIEYEYMKERLQQLIFDQELLDIAANNLIITPRVQLSFNSEEIDEIKNTVKERFKPDIIAIDPLRNIFNSSEYGNENDNSAMLFFLQKTLEKLRNIINPDAGIILTHHTKKLSKKMLEEDPFQGLSGAGSLRGFYTTGMVMFSQDEGSTVRQIVFELRNGERVPSKLVDKTNGSWQLINQWNN